MLFTIIAKQLYPLPSVSVKSVEPDMIPHMLPKRGKAGSHVKFYRAYKKQGVAFGAVIGVLISSGGFYFLVSELLHFFITTTTGEGIEFAILLNIE